MSDHTEQGERLGHEIDCLLRQEGRAADDPSTPTYDEALETARALSTLDLDADGRAQNALRSKVLSAAKAMPNRNVAAPWPRRPLRVLWVLTLPVAGFMLIVGLALVWPGALTALARTWETSVQRLFLREPLQTRILAVPQRITPVLDLLDRQFGPQSVLVLPDGEAPITFSSDLGEPWVVHTSIGTFRGYGHSGGSDLLERYRTLEDTLAAAPYPLREPGYVPTGYGFREGVITPSRATYYLYQGPSEEIVLAQVSYQATRERAMAVLATMTDRPITRVAVGEHPGSWIEGHGLIWETSETTLLVGGPSLDLDEATRIALSLH